MSLAERTSQPGKELDELVATKVLGWYHDEIYWYSERGFEANFSNDHDEEWHRFSPSTDLNDAFEVVEYLKSLGYKFALVLDGKNEQPYSCLFDKNEKAIVELINNFGVNAESASVAICLSAFKTLKIQI